MRGLEYPLFIGGNSSCFITFFILPLTIKVVVLIAKQVTFTFCSCIQGWKFWFFLPKFRRNFMFWGGQQNEKGGRNVGGRNIRKFRQISEKFPFVSVYFGDFSPIFWKNWRLEPAIDPTAPNFPALIWISTFFPIN